MLLRINNPDNMKKYALCLAFILAISTVVYCSPSEGTQADDTAELPSNETMRAEMEKTQAKIASNPELMKAVANLALDPQFQELMKDPEIANAVKSQDFKFLMQNDKFMSLMNNRNLQGLKDKVEAQDD